MEIDACHCLAQLLLEKHERILQTVILYNRGNWTRFHGPNFVVNWYVYKVTVMNLKSIISFHLFEMKIAHKIAFDDNYMPLHVEWHEHSLFFA